MMSFKSLPFNSETLEFYRMCSPLASRLMDSIDFDCLKYHTFEDEDYLVEDFKNDEALNQHYADMEKLLEETEIRIYSLRTELSERKIKIEDGYEEDDPDLIPGMEADLLNLRIKQRFISRLYERNGIDDLQNGSKFYQYHQVKMKENARTIN